MQAPSARTMMPALRAASTALRDSLPGWNHSAGTLSLMACQQHMQTTSIRQLCKRSTASTHVENNLLASVGWSDDGYGRALGSLGAEVVQRGHAAHALDHRLFWVHRRHRQLAVQVPLQHHVAELQISASSAFDAGGRSARCTFEGELDAPATAKLSAARKNLCALDMIVNAS